MAAQGKVDIRNFRVIPGPSLPPAGYPFRVSTRLYPEWPFAVVAGTDDNLSRNVAVSLMSMVADDRRKGFRRRRLDNPGGLLGCSRAPAGTSCWTIQGPGPDKSGNDPFLVLAISARGTGAIFLISLFAVRSWILNRRLKGSMQECRNGPLP